jgi:hypothetical protein
MRYNYDKRAFFELTASLLVYSKGLEIEMPYSIGLDPTVTQINFI